MGMLDSVLNTNPVTAGFSNVASGTPFNWVLNGQGSASGVGPNLADQASNMSKLSSDLQGRSDAQWEKYNNLYAPVEEQAVQDAENIDSQQNQDAAAANASSQVRSSAAQARAATERNNASMGINPASGRSQDTENQLDMATAAQDADAQNQARQAVRDRGIAMRQGVVQQGNNVANNSTLNAQTALGGYNGSGNLTIGGTNANTGAFNANTTANAAQLSGLTNVFNTGMGTLSGLGAFGSSKKIKENMKNVSDESTLDKLKKIPVGTWKYKDGQGDGGDHMGAYAEDVHKQFGDRAAPQGKMIDAISMHGITLSAVKGLAKQVDKLNAKVNKLSAAH